MDLLDAILEMKERTRELKPLDQNIPNNETPDICSQCKGHCCKTVGCEWSVEDFKKHYGEVTEENIKKALADGKIALDWWEGDYRTTVGIPVDENDLYGQCYYFRMRHIGEEAICPSWGGTCVALTETGCSYSWEDRPLGGRQTTPRFDRLDEDGVPICTRDNSKLDFLHDWFPYNDLLEKICDELYPSMCKGLLDRLNID